MAEADLINEILKLYQKHGWRIRRFLLTAETRSKLTSEVLKDCSVEESTLDAVWLSRPSHQGREAWELRLLAEQQFALFETFEMDEPEEEREEMRREMEAKMRDYVTKLAPS